MKKSRITRKQIEKEGYLGYIYDTRKYRYILADDGKGVLRTEIWKLDTTAMCEPDAWEYLDDPEAGAED